MDKITKEEISRNLGRIMVDLGYSLIHQDSQMDKITKEEISRNLGRIIGDLGYGLIHPHSQLADLKEAHRNLRLLIFDIEEIKIPKD